MKKIKRTPGEEATTPRASRGELRLRIEYLDPTSLSLWDENPRRNDAAAKKLAVLIEEHGFGQPVTMREEDGIVYKGNTRVKAAIILRMSAIPVMRRSYPNVQDAIDDAIADNVAGTWSEFDEDLLFDALQERDEITVEALSRRTGLEQGEIERLREGCVLSENDPAREWRGMPEYEHEDQEAKRKIIVHFKSDEDAEAFGRAIGQTITEKTNSLWFPPDEIGVYQDKHYGENGELYE